jgi:NAD(P)-dependent dehydrogenase (short-subunit alcohol dehydrogenase family)
MSSTCVIAGARGGVGTALATLLRSRGWRVARISRDVSTLTVDPDDEDDFAIQSDISTPVGAEAAFSEATARFGVPAQAFVNCAGSTLIAPLSRTREPQYRDVLRANLDTSFFGIQAWLATLSRSEHGGAAVLFSSVVARIGVANHPAIAAAKGAVEAFARSIAADVSSQGIRINVIAPGLVRSPMNERMLGSEGAQRQIAAQYPLGRYGEVADAAALAAWLVSEQSGWITGQVIGLDGGFTAVRPYVKAGA